ncbi:MAG: M14 family metallopeptidase [Lacrimispora sp.]|uniref:M14 family metallopeptidase n=1 Tax=Lacrimispora sp. TaxID=2719234 RepID=UPI0039E29BF4
MIISVASVPLPVDETLEIKKSRFCPTDGGNGKRISIVTGIHGDELEGQLVCFQMAKKIRENPEHLLGTVDLYPALNPMGLDSITRGIPGFDLDMNRIFPGTRDGSFTEYIAMEIVEDLVGSDLCLDIHASNIYLTELPQIRINELHKDKLVPLAMEANVDFVWVHGANTVLESTLAHSMNSLGVPTLVAEMGVGMRLTPSYASQLTEGIFHLMQKLHIWKGEEISVKKPVLSEGPEDVCYINAPVSGIFLKKQEHGSRVYLGDEVGAILNPFTGEEMEQITAPCTGLLFTIREYPVVDEGSLIARILKQEEDG